MPWNISQRNWHAFTLLQFSIFFLGLSLLSGCAFGQRQVEMHYVPPPPIPEAVVLEPIEPELPALAPDEVEMRIDMSQQSQKTRVRKIDTQSMAVGQRISFSQGEDVLRVLRYNEETFVLPKMRASKDFSIRYKKVPNGKSSAKNTVTVSGFADVTYETLPTSVSDRMILVDTILLALNKDGTLSKNIYLRTDREGIFRKVKASFTPSDVTFSNAKRSKVISGSEEHYVIKFVEKKGMSVLFEVRHLEGGSNPKVVKRETVTVPLGTPDITINGHDFKIHTITPDVLDIERLS